MLSNDEIQQLKSENELLQIQLQDITEMIAIREEELEILRKKAAYTVQLKSELEGNMAEITQMQNLLGEHQQKAFGAARRELAMENEIIQSLEMEKELYDIRDRYSSAKAAIKDLDNELAETSSMYNQLNISISRIAELESSLEIVLMENAHLKERIEEIIQKPD